MPRGRRSRPNSIEVDPCTSYLEHLRQDRGLGPKALSDARRGVRDFLTFLEPRGVQLEQVELADVDAYLGALADAQSSASLLKIRAIAVRGFLRYLSAEGILARDISGWVEGPRSYRDATVPPCFTWRELEQLCSSVTGEDPLGLRDLAMLALLCCYGLRSQEVAGLTLDSIDWAHQRLQISLRKGDRPLLLPLVEAVKIALQRYLKTGRPVTTHRQIFISRWGTPLRSAEISRRLQALTKRAGLPGERGAHAIRRAVGTRLVEEGWGLAEVAQILGHGSLDSPRVYLRLSTKLLQDVALNYAELL